MKLKKNIFKLKYIYIVSVLVFFSLSRCVPVKKQMIVKDLKRKTLKSLKEVDTILNYPQYTYRLKKNDILAMSFGNITKGEYDITELGKQGSYSAVAGRVQGGMQGSPNNSGYIVNDSGYVILPVLGAIKVLGLTLKEAEREIQIKTNELLDNTTVNVRLISFFVYMMGEVNMQGQVFAPGDRLTIIEAIALSGGLTDYADRQRIKIIRNQNNQAHIYYIDLSDQNLIQKNEIYLLPQDIIIVEPLRDKVLRTYTIPNITLALSSLTFLLTLTLTFLNLAR
jgi:polysaccharide export outer membrane protein